MAQRPGKPRAAAGRAQRQRNSDKLPKNLKSSFPAQHTHTEADFTHSSEEAELLTGGSFQKYIWAEAENIWSDGILITER